MSSRWVFLASYLLVAASGARAETVTSIPQGDKEPLLCLQAGGPTAFVTGLAFSPDGKTLYATGFDKVVRVWTLDASGNRFQLDSTAYRVPVGPGLEGGALNALALSSDGTWLAVGGLGLTRGGSGFHMLGWTLPVIGGLNTEMRRDQGMIYVFNTKDGSVRLLRGHTGPVLSLAFAPGRANVPPLLVSAAREWDEKKNAYVRALLLWDLDKATYLAGYVFPDRQTKPALAVQTRGPQAKQLRVAIAWEDRVLRVWDVESGQFLTADEAENNNTAAFSGPARLVTGSENRLQVWDLRGNQVKADSQVPFAGTKTEVYFPRALALCSAAASGQVDHAAAVVRRVTRAGEEDWLYLIELTPAHFGAVKARVSLGQGGGSLPVVTASPRGRFLAVAGYADHAVRVYAIPALLGGREEPMQVLRSIGVTLRHVQFVRKGNNPGLLLSEAEEGVEATERAELPEGRIFDFANRSVTSDRDGWQVAPPRRDGWQVSLSPVIEANADKRRAAQRSFALVVSQGGRQVGRTELNDIGDVTAYALLPPQPRLPVPILAIAYRDKYFQSRLSLYDAAAGEEVRLCTGHLDRIRSLAFSADAKLLASAADDQTVCVWSLIDLDLTLKLRGMLHGVAVQERGKDVVVAQADAKSLAPQNRGKLHEGDVLEAILDGGKFRPLTSAYDFYDTMWHTIPGKSVALRVRGVPNEVRVRVGQGADERKPLFSLFLAHPPQRQEWEWVGWNPVGFYESSGNNAERYVGWHFNTGKPDHPTSFALADQYHKQYFRKGILQSLVAEGRLPKQEPEVQLPRPNMTLWIDEVGLHPEQVDGRVLVRQPRATLRLAINNFPLEKVASLTCSLDGGPPLELPSGAGQSPSLPFLLKPGRHDVSVVLRTRETDPKKYEELLAVLYLPPPPEVTSELPRRQIVDKPEFRFQAQVRAALPGQEMAVRLLRRHKEEVQEKPAQRGPTIDQDFQLQPGENLIELIAQNNGAVSPYEQFETTAQAWSVFYRKKDPPLITWSAVGLLDGTSAKGGSLSIEPGKPVVVDTPRVRVEGQLKATEKLAEATGKLGEIAPRPLATFEAHKAREYTIHEELMLKPGSQKFRVWAKTDMGDENESTVTIEYRPRLPHLVLSLPRAGTILSEGQDPREVQLAGTLELPPDPREFAVAVLVNGVPADTRPVLDSSRRRLTANVSLQFGDNRIQVRLSNAWQVTSVSEPVVVHYARPPRGLLFPSTQSGMRPLTDLIAWPRWASVPGIAQVTEKPVADLVARLDSTQPVTFVQAEVNGRLIAATQAVAPTQPHEATWTVLLKDVTLDRGTNRVRLWASNDDGRCLTPGAVTVYYLPPAPPPPPPDVEILDPRRDITVDSPSYSIQYRARSTSRLRRVELRRNGQTLDAVDVAGLERDAQGFLEARAKKKVSLAPGANHFQVLAVNAGGQAEAVVTLSYVYKPVTLIIDELELRGGQSRSFRPEQKENNRLSFSEVPAGQLWLHGRVHWEDQEDGRLKLPTDVWVGVNGYRHVTQLEPWSDKGLDRSFAVEIELSKPKDNRLDIQVPGLPQEEGKTHAFTIDCRQPVVRKQHLHLLIVGNGEKDSDKLRQRVLGALQATPVAKDRFKTPSFEDGYIYDVLAGEHIDHGAIWPRLQRIQKGVSYQAKGDHANHVIMVYYRGSEADWNRLTYDNLASFFAGTPGAQVLLLDITRDAAETASTAPGQPSQGQADPYVGLLCYIWVNRGRPQTDEAQLITDLKTALGKVGKLGQVVSWVDSKFVWDATKSIWVSKDYRQSLLYRREFPDQLRELAIGARP